MDSLLKKLFYAENNILSKNEIWNEIKNDATYTPNIRRADFLNWLAKHEDVQIETLKNKPKKAYTHPL